MNVPLNDCRRQNLGLAAEMDEAIRRVLTSGRYLLGPETESFEAEFAAHCHRKHAVSVGNGTDALEIALRALGCGPGDEVVTVPNAGMYATTAVLQVGAAPVFADVEENTLLISPESVKSVLSEKTRAVVVTHLYGKLANMIGVREAVGDRRIPVLEDCAHAHGAERDGSPAGSFGEIATFSFYPTKNLGAIGDGGAIVTDRTDLFERVTRLHQYGWQQRFHAAIPYGRNSRMDELQAACLRVKLPFLDGWNRRRREIVQRYIKAALATRFRIVHKPERDTAAHLCVARHPAREEVFRQMRQSGVAVTIHYPVLDHQQAALASIPWRENGLEAAAKAQKEIFTLPCFPELNEDEVSHVCAVLRQVG